MKLPVGLFVSNSVVTARMEERAQVHLPEERTWQLKKKMYAAY